MLFRSVDSVIRYFVAHNFLMNYDSYTGSMLHNYGLYEQDGILSIIPWDYNLAFGGFNQEEGATAIVNWAIDTPLSSGTNLSRPLWGRIAEDESYMQLYHNYFSELIENYFLTGEYGEEVNRIYEMIRPYVENDPTAWYSVNEFEQAVDTLKEFCELRVQSIKGQLNGSIPATTQEQLNAQATLIDASGITISDMGSQMNGNKKENKRN